MNWVWDLDNVGTKEELILALNKDETMPGVVKQACIQILHVFHPTVKLDVSTMGVLDDQTGTGNSEIHIDPYSEPPPDPSPELMTTNQMSSKQIQDTKDKFDKE